MNKVRQNKLIKIIFIAIVLTSVSALVLFALKQNINLFFSPSDILEKKVSENIPIKIGGMVLKNSINKNDLKVTFKITDYKSTVNVFYEGTLPTLFREEQGVVVFGKLNAKGEFEASQILAKHDENYMPKEVRDSLKVQKA